MMPLDLVTLQSVYFPTRVRAAKHNTACNCISLSFNG